MRAAIFALLMLLPAAALAQEGGLLPEPNPAEAPALELESEGGIRSQILPPPASLDDPLPQIDPLPEGLGGALPAELSAPAFPPPGPEAPASPGIAREMCELRVNGLVHVLALDPEAAEELRRPRRGGLAPCPASQIFGYLGERYELAELEGYCLADEEDGSALLVPGTRNRHGRCQRTVCERVRAQAQETRDTAGFMAERLNATLSGEPGGVQSRAGALIVSGAVNWVAGNIGTVGSALGSALSSPAVLGVATVSVVAVGGALYLCRE